MTTFLIAIITAAGKQEVIKQGFELTGSQWIGDCSKIHQEAEESAAQLKNDNAFSSYDVKVEVSGFQTLSGRPEFIRLGEEFFTFENIELEE